MVERGKIESGKRETNASLKVSSLGEKYLPAAR